jgi:hypothetical protein
MKFLQLLERAWILATITALGVTVLNIFKYKTFDYHVYFPLFCAAFCGFLYYNVKSQRTFAEKIRKEKEEEEKKK